MCEVVEGGLAVDQDGLVHDGSTAKNEDTTSNLPSHIHQANEKCLRHHIFIFMGPKERTPISSTYGCQARDTGSVHTVYHHLHQTAMAMETGI